MPAITGSSSLYPSARLGRDDSAVGAMHAGDNSNANANANANQGLLTTRSQRKMLAGIDCPDKVLFSKWQPLREYSASLTLKNATTRTLKLRYRLPKSKVFFLNYPEHITLSAGMACSIPITFRPLSVKNAYKDVLSVTTSIGSFVLPLIAVLPQTRLEFPDVIEFGLCSVNQVNQKVMSVANSGDVVSGFQWQVPTGAPFRVEPESGKVLPNEKVNVTVTFLPTAAGSFRSTLVCTYGDNSAGSQPDSAAAFSGRAPLTVSGVGKFARIYATLPKEPTRRLSTIKLGSCPVGQKRKLTFHIVNPSMVRTLFVLRPLLPSASASASSPLPSPITLSSTSGTLDPMGSAHEVQVTFHPTQPGTRLCDPWELACPGMLTPIRLTFTANVPLVSIAVTPSAIAFGDVLVSSGPVNRIIHLENTADVPAVVQLDGLTATSPVFSLHLVDKGAAFVGLQVGIVSVEPRSSVAVTVRFEPTVAGVYHREVRGRIENGNEFIVDLVGTGYTETQRPPALELAHLEQYRHRRGIGLGLHGPEQVEHLLKLGTLSLASTTGLLTWTSPADLASDDTLSMLQSTPFASLDQTNVDFAACTRYRYIEPRTLTLTNHSHTKVLCAWIPSPSPSPTTFLIEPPAAELAPKAIQTFRVSYRPEIDDAVDSMDYVCVVTPKAMRSFRLVGEDAAITPSCMLGVKVIGNTLSSHMAMTKVDFPALAVAGPPGSATPAQVVLPPAVPSGPKVSRTFKVTNVGDCPAHFTLTFPSTLGTSNDSPHHHRTSSSSPWTVSPMSGVIPIRGSMLIRAEFDPCAHVVSNTSPSTNHTVTQPLLCMLNGTLSTSHAFTLSTLLAQPALSILPSAALTLAPTLVDLIGTRTGALRNASAVPMRFTWRVPAAHASMLAIDPPAGVLDAHAESSFTIQFTPTAPAKVLVHTTLTYALVSPSDPDYVGPERRTTVVIGATGVAGALAAAHKEVRLPQVLVNTPYITGSQAVVVTNATECTVGFQARLVQALAFSKNGRKVVEYGPPEQPEDLYVMTTRDRVPPHASRPILVHLLLREQKEYWFKVQLALDVKGERWVDLCSVVATGVFPRMKVTGVASNVMGSYDLHQSCNIDAINNALQLGASKRVLPVVFPPRLVGSQDTSVEWVLQNVGPAPLQWSMTTPRSPTAVVSPDETAVPPASSSSPPSTGNAHDAKSFSISHRSGSLQPGATHKLTLACKHVQVGTLEQAVQLQVKGGPECDGVIPLLFTSTTIGPRQGLLFHAGSVQDFGPIPIDTPYPVQRDMVLHNMGEAPVWFAIDKRSLDDVQAANLGFPIFACARTHASIAGGDKLVVPITFHPIEAKPYAATLTLTMVGTGGGAGVASIPPLQVHLRGQGVPAYCALPPLGTAMGVQAARAAGLTKKCTALARTSRVCLDFAEVEVRGLPMNAMCTRVVTLQNAGSAPTNYLWSAVATDEEQVRILPPAGRLAPGEHVLVRVFVRGAVGGPGASAHMFECLSGESMSALQNEVANHRAQHRSNLGSAGSHAGAVAASRTGSASATATAASLLNKYSTALPAIGTPAKISKCELTVHVETVLDSTRSHYVPRLRHPFVCCPSPMDASLDALDEGQSAKRDAIAHVMRFGLDQVVAQVERDGTLDWIHGHVDWHFPPSVWTGDGEGCPQTVAQDVLEGVLFAIVEEMKRGGA